MGPTTVACGWVENYGDEWEYDGCAMKTTDDGITCECDHQTVFNLIEDLRTDQTKGMSTTTALQADNVYLGFLFVYCVLAVASTSLLVTLIRINNKQLATTIIAVITLQIYFHCVEK